jgi:hypothetical protein
VTLFVRRVNLISLPIFPPTAWGTFEPAVRFVYQIQPNIPPFVFSFVYYVVAASALLFLHHVQLPWMMTFGSEAT